MNTRPSSQRPGNGERGLHRRADNIPYQTMIIENLFPAWKKLAGAPHGKPGHRAYAVGDIHGCFNETINLLEKIKFDNAYRIPMKTYIIFLGDLVDRGPQSKDVIELMMDFPYDFASPIFLMGNHEEMMVRGLMGEPELLPDWLNYGGFACAESYGVQRQELHGLEDRLIEKRLRAAIPKAHVEFLKGFAECVRFGDFLFAHAGIRPDVPIDKQDSRELRWIREPFLSFKGKHGFVVVHGHTITDGIDVQRNRIGIDTGAHKTGTLTAICIEDDDVSFLTTS